jgi:hypothetical protein
VLEQANRNKAGSVIMRFFPKPLIDIVVAPIVFLKINLGFIKT